MIVEILAIGTELLLGQIVNSNATRIGERLADAGLDHFQQIVVGDNEAPGSPPRSMRRAFAPML